MSKRKKTSASLPPVQAAEELAQDDGGDEHNESVTTRASVPPEVMKQAMGDDGPVSEPIPDEDVPVDADGYDIESTVNLVGDLPLPGRDDLDAPTVTASGDALEEVDHLLLQRKHLRGLLESLVFASDSPIKAPELAKLASAPLKQVKELLAELKQDFSTRGVHLDEVAGGWVFRTSPQYAPFVRDLTKQKPVRLTRAQVETLAIIAYRQPITRPEVDDVRGVDSGPVLKLLLERDLVRILGKRDEPGRPIIYGTTSHFLEFFGLKSLKDLPTLREFTELSEESREAFEDELGEAPDAADAADAAPAAPAGPRDTAVSEDEASALGEEEPHDASPPRESMRVPIGEQAVDELGEDDLEPVDEGEALAPERHASDDDGPTLTSEAPTPDEE